MSKFRRVVATIHGINSDGDWQKEVGRVLEPHFRHIPLHYEQFRRLGWPRILSGRLRRQALESVVRQFSQEVVAGDRPHLIAHSFGTWIAAQLMKRPGVSFNRVVFAGSTLPANFDWEGELADNRGAFYDLTNERGVQDSVVAMAGTTGKVCAGEVGFRGPVELIHDTGALRDSCPLCKGLEVKAQACIHNLRWKDFKHSDWFVGSSHSANLWLPYLWGFPPEEYSEFIETCLRLAEMDSRGEWLNMKQAEKDFQARRWSWTKRGHAMVSLSEYVASNIVEYLRLNGHQSDQDKVENIRDRAIRLIWIIIGEAIEERRKPFAEQQENLILRLHPQLAISTAIDTAARS